MMELARSILASAHVASRKQKDAPVTTSILQNARIALKYAFTRKPITRDPTQGRKRAIQHETRRRMRKKSQPNRITGRGVSRMRDILSITDTQ